MSATAADSARHATGLYSPRPRAQVLRDLVNRSRRSLEALDEPALDGLLEDALWHERKRLGRTGGEDEERHHLDDLARALVNGSREARVAAGLHLVEDWADEIHGRFNPRVYRIATRAVPRGLTALLSGRPSRLRDWRLDSNSHLKVTGNLELLRTLSREATLILAPTHMSNLDAPLIGLALYLAGLPPFVYGAGLNLFDNPVTGWWMHRLGAYTVDRRKRAQMYKELLKNYSVRALTTRHHSLFFPGGTRCRSGEIETRLKKGLLGTGIVAWQEMLTAQRPDSEVYVVPLTLSFTLVLEANTLISDHLAEAGKQRYIISDDEFAQPRRLASFARRVLDLDSGMVAHFGAPIDVLGNPVSADLDQRREQAQRRRGYVCGRDGTVQWDDQRDRVYTDRLATSISDAFPRYAEVLPTHLVAWSAWRCLVRSVGSGDPFRLVRVPAARRRFPREVLLADLRQELERVRTGAAKGRWTEDLPATAEQILEIALDRFDRYHRSHAVALRDSDIFVEDPKLCLYYRNRLTFMDRDLPSFDRGS